MSQPRDVTSDEASSLLGAGGAVAYVDVRSTTEYTQGHVPGSINVPLAEMDPLRGMTPNPDFVSVVEKLFTKDQQLILGCASGGRSAQACRMLAAAGFGNLMNLRGGFAGPGGWRQTGLPVSNDGTTYADAKKKAGV